MVFLLFSTYFYLSKIFHVISNYSFSYYVLLFYTSVTYLRSYSTIVGYLVLALSCYRCTTSLPTFAFALHVMINISCFDILSNNYFQLFIVFVFHLVIIFFRRSFYVYYCLQSMNFSNIHKTSIQLWFKVFNIFHSKSAHPSIRKQIAISNL